MQRPVLVYVVSEDWYFCSHRMPLAVAAQDLGFRVIVVTRVRDHGEPIRRAGLTLISLDMRRSGLNPFRDIVTIARLTRLYRRESPELVHHVAMKPVICGTLAARLAGVPHVVNALAGMGWLFSSGDRLARLLRPGVRHVLGKLLGKGITVVQNADDAGLLARLGVDESRIRTVLGSGVDMTRFRPGHEPAGVPLVVLPARLLKEKGIVEFVGAARILRRRGVEARFMLAGQPDPANPSSIDSSQLDQWEREGLVDCPGWIEDIPSLLSRASLVCLPSYREGLPLALAEAAAAGRAIVATDVPGCREVVRDGENGVLVPPRDATALADALERLLRDPAMRQRMGERGRLRAEQDFRAEDIIAKMLGVYRGILAGELNGSPAAREMR